MNRTHIFNTAQLSKEDTQELNRIAYSTKKEYGEFINSYSKREKTLFWWVLPLSSRNNYHDQTYENICLLLLCIEKIKTNSVDEIVTSNKAIFFDLKKYCKKSDVSIKIKYYQSGNKGNNKRKNIFFHQIIAEIKRVVAIQKIIGRKVIPTGYEDMLFIPVPSSCIKDNKFNDLYFGNIDKIVNRKMLYCPTLSYYDMKEWNKVIHILEYNQEHEFIYKEQFQRKRDYLYVLLYRLYCVKLSRAHYFWGDIEISHLVRASLINGIDNTTSWEAILTDIVFKRMQNEGICIERFIIWFEGRPCDIMLAKTLHTYFPNSRSIGYVGFPIGEINDCLSPIDEQIRQGAFPDYITVSGEAYKKQINRFSQNAHFLVVPIVRNNYSVRTKLRTDDNSLKILIAMSYFEDYNYEMVRLIDLFVKANKKKCIIYIKNHPVFYHRRIEDYYDKSISFNPIYVEGKLSDCLKECDIAMTTKSTATMEVICSNVYLLIYSPLGEILNTALPETLSSDYYGIVYDYEDLERNITANYQKFLSIAGNQFSVESFFCEPNKKNLDIMFQI